MALKNVKYLLRFLRFLLRYNFSHIKQLMAATILGIYININVREFVIHGSDIYIESGSTIDVSTCLQ